MEGELNAAALEDFPGGSVAKTPCSQGRGSYEPEPKEKSYFILSKLWTTKTTAYAMVDNRHAGQCNVLFADGHTESLAISGSKYTFTANSNPYKTNHPFNSFNNSTPDPFWRPEI